ncbi:MAG: type I restriction endonuclease subunit R [Proteobacteria bacterium]|nr:type I restriction endonuclease subunit R [Pseudomonadota bacterium]
MKGFHFDEKYLSQIPALQLLINLGYEYLPPEQALNARQNKTRNILLESILRDQLKQMNRIHYKGREHRFSEENIQSAIEKLAGVKYEGLRRTNETRYDLLTLGVTQEQTIEGDNKSFNLHYIDWRHWQNNVFHVTAEFSVDRPRSQETARPDIVLFVNGIPFVVIECKSPDIDVEEGISQSIRNQTDDYIPGLFTYVQMLIAINKNSARFGTVGTAAKFWAVWHEKNDQVQTVFKQVNKPLMTVKKDLLFTEDFSIARPFFDAMATEGQRQVTEQDSVLHSLARPERLIELVYKFIVFDAGIKKIARYQQYFSIQRILQKVKQRDSEGRRQGGVIWHTQGSGKSLTMVMLTRCLAFDEDIVNPRIVLVTDRKDLDKQLGNTFAACGLDPQQAKTGRDLLELVSEKKAGIITTLVHKFDKAMNVKKYQDDSGDIFMLIDEGHRTQFGAFAARMRQMFPKACYLGFTGTPLMRKERNNFAKFGGLIDQYSIEQAVKDKAVVPLLYEARHVEMEQNQKAIDLWFERHTQGLSKAQKADLKKKYARAEMLNKTDQVITMRAFDISEHFREHWQGTGFKAQLVAPGKVAALKYQECLDEIGYLRSEVVISAPDNREGYADIDDGPADVVVKFWQKMMQRFGNEEEYNKQITEQFIYAEQPDLLIVVSKLLTGFDAPPNTVLYLCSNLREHNLLQAIARVNRLYEDEDKGAEKEFGYIVDYVSVLGELDRALSMYSAFKGYEDLDLMGTITSIKEQVSKLPQRHSNLWDLFKTVKNQYDEKAYEVLLGDDALREEFYERLMEYSKGLAIAFSSEDFIMNIDDQKLQQYKNDLKRFHKLKASIKLRYAEAINYRDYEPRIKKLLDTHISASAAIQLNAPVNIFDEATFNQVKDDRGVYKSKTPGSKADAIAHASKKAITEHMEEDPAFYQKFSKLIQQAIDDFRAKRISDMEYLNMVLNYSDRVAHKKHDDVPDDLSNNDHAIAFFGNLKPLLNGNTATGVSDETIIKITFAILAIFETHRKINYWDDHDAQKQTMNEIDDYLYDDVKGTAGIALSTEKMDEIIDTTMRLAKSRRLV